MNAIPLLRRAARLLLMLTLLCHQAQAAAPDLTLQTLLAESRPAHPAGCATETDHLRRILCTGTIRIGVRGNYPLFGFVEADQRSGYEVAIARHLAKALGVTPAITTVSPANRLASLAEDQVDLVIATMGHTTARDREVRFIRPHYYSSSTILIGPKDIELPGFDAIAGRTVCSTVGNASTAQLSQHGARLLLFDSPEQLIDQLNAQACLLAAQDDSFFAQSFTVADFAARYSEKFRFAALPWGMAVSPHNSETLARALSLLSQTMHRDGVFLALAQANHIDTNFLQAQRTTWSTPPCDRDSAATDPGCVLEPLRTDLAPTVFAPKVTALETELGTQLRIHPTLGILKIQPAWDLLKSGIANTITLVAGALLATMLFAVLIGQGLTVRAAIIRVPMKALLIGLQSSPVVLSLTIGAAVVNQFVTFSAESALITAMIVLGLTNGANAGHAVADAVTTLRRETPGRSALFPAALRRASVQITAFLINAAKGSPAASLIGAPELLNAVSDSGSFTSDRITTYWMLLVFYICLVLVVSSLCRTLRGLLDRVAVA